MKVGNIVDTSLLLGTAVVSYLQCKVVLSRVGMRQARPALPRRDGEGVLIVSRRVG